MDTMILPNFLCIGAPKSATTTLYEILKQHPEIGVSSFKEPHFFDNNLNYSADLRLYSKSYFSELSSKRLIGEFTPTYFSHKECPRRIKQTLGNNLKFIIILRNPVDRAYSHYLHTKRDMFEELPFLQALSLERERLNSCLSEDNNTSYLKYAYIETGLYYKHLKNYLDYFHRDQFHIMIFEEFIHNRRKVIKDLLEFLQVDKNIEINLDIYSNQASKARSTIIKQIMKKDFLLKRLIKKMIPSLSMRQQIRNRIHASNNKVVKKPPLSEDERKVCYSEYFKKDIELLENSLSIKLENWKPC